MCNDIKSRHRNSGTLQGPSGVIHNLGHGSEQIIQLLDRNWQFRHLPEKQWIELDQTK